MSEFLAKDISAFVKTTDVIYTFDNFLSELGAKDYTVCYMEEERVVCILKGKEGVKWNWVVYTW